MFLEVRGIHKSFGGLTALEDVSLRVEKGRVVGLIGPNGSGKSTLFDIVTGFQKADTGGASFMDRRIDHLLPHEIVHLGLMRTFQLSEGGERLTALENLLASAGDQREHNLIASVLYLGGLLRRERDNLAKAKEILDLLGLDQVANEYVGNLSGGQRKLIDLGRVFMARPALCLLDEPTAGVNPTLVHVILDALKRMNSEGITVFIVEHNMQVISEVCDHVYVLDAGMLISEGSPESIQVDDRVLQSYLGRSRAVGGDRLKTGAE